MLFFYIRKIKKGQKDFKIEVKLFPIRKEEKEKILCGIFDILFSKSPQGEKPDVDGKVQKDRIKSDNK